MIFLLFGDSLNVQYFYYMIVQDLHEVEYMMNRYLPYSMFNKIVRHERWKLAYRKVYLVRQITLISGKGAR